MSISTCKRRTRQTVGCSGSILSISCRRISPRSSITYNHFTFADLLSYLGVPPLTPPLPRPPPHPFLLPPINIELRYICTCPVCFCRRVRVPFSAAFDCKHAGEWLLEGCGTEKAAGRLWNGKSGLTPQTLTKPFVITPRVGRCWFLRR